MRDGLFAMFVACCCVYAGTSIAEAPPAEGLPQTVIYQWLPFGWHYAMTCESLSGINSLDQASAAYPEFEPVLISKSMHADRFTWVYYEPLNTGHPKSIRSVYKDIRACEKGLMRIEKQYHPSRD